MAPMGDDPTDPVRVDRHRAAAQHVLQLAINGDVDEANRVLQAFAESMDVVNWYIMLITWADGITWYRFGPAGPDPGLPVVLSFIDPDSPYRAPASADSVDPDVAWVGRLYAARLANDTATLEALVAALDRDRLAGCVSAGLQLAALACQGHGTVGIREVTR